MRTVTAAAAILALASCATASGPATLAEPRAVHPVAVVTDATDVAEAPARPERAMPAPHAAHVVAHVAPVAVRPVAVRQTGTRARPWFSTPQRAMRYLAWAYSTKHDAAVAHVTTPNGRRALLAMRGYAPAIGLRSCTRLAAGDYECLFWHSLAKHPGKTGTMTFRVAPAVRHGWYMTVLEDCGDGETV
jgi:hypothetical protein